ncbi:MAG TPA: hypothetical protein VJB59_04325 [Bdellovibrionota bacterium]|nr:hypothetical protein [Bdellovibrionota bacterium]
MGHTNSKKGHNTTNSKQDNTVEVLYQKMGDRWFAFSLIGDEVFVGSLRQDEIDCPDVPVVEGPHRYRDLQ